MVSIKVERRRNGEQVLERITASLQGSRKVKVGFPAGQADAGILERAVYNEFGTSRGIPERPFLRGAMRANRPDYKVALRESAQRILAGESDIRQELERLGFKAVGDIQREIQTLSSPPNAPSTIRRKGSSNPLIDTGQMRQAVTHKVDE